MPTDTPHHFTYHHYLQTILHRHQREALFIATEQDFQPSGGIAYPYRSYFYALGLLHDGQRRLRVGFRDFDLRAQSLTVVGPGITRLWLDSHWHVGNTTLFFTADYFPSPFNRDFLFTYPFFQPGAQHVLQLSDTHYQQANAFIDLLRSHAKDPSVAAGVLFAFLAFLDKIYADYMADTTRVRPQHVLVHRFTQLLHQHFQAEKHVRFYAQHLKISAKHLSAILKQETGYSAKQLIDDFVLFEAKSLLRQTHLHIQEVAYWLGYDDPSYFSRVFKEKVGVTPLQYRE